MIFCSFIGVPFESTDKQALCGKARENRERRWFGSCPIAFLGRRVPKRMLQIAPSSVIP